MKLGVLNSELPEKYKYLYRILFRFGVSDEKPNFKIRMARPIGFAVKSHNCETAK
jgi:hypothetical protein